MFLDFIDEKTVYQRLHDSPSVKCKPVTELKFDLCLLIPVDGSLKGDKEVHGGGGAGHLGVIVG